MKHKNIANQSGGHRLFPQAIQLITEGKKDQAKPVLLEIINDLPNDGQSHFLLGSIFKETNQLTEAEKHLCIATKQLKTVPEASRQYAQVLRSLEQFSAAETIFQQLIRNDSRSVQDYDELALTYDEQCDFEKAISTYHQALKQAPSHPQLLHHLGKVYLHAGLLENAFENLRLSAELVSNHARPITGKHDVLFTRIKHDYEQINFLEKKCLLATEFNAYKDNLARLYEYMLAEGLDKVEIDFNDPRQDISPSFNRIVYFHPAEPIAGGVINPALNVADIEKRYFASRPEIIYIDDFFKPEAVKNLREYCLYSTVWKSNYKGGYLGSMLGAGFASPLLLQISHEMKQTFKTIFQAYNLHQAWSFKCDNTKHGIEMHADFATVNVNFWISDETGNRNPETGGLLVWDVEAPRDWPFEDYNRNEAKAMHFLKEQKANVQRIAHKTNRVLIFNSALFHKTDEIDFADEYEKRRLNVTLLYGSKLPV